MNAYQYFGKLKTDTVANKSKIDSLMISLNNKCADAYKEIKVDGIKGIEDPGLSIYNTLGIKVMVLFDNKIALTYELAIPLKYLHISANHFKYNIRLNSARSHWPL